MEKRNVNLLIIATNKYVGFIEKLLDSADKYFMKAENVRYKIFTDRMNEVEEIVFEKDYDEFVDIFKVEHKPWPHATLKRFHFFRNNFDHLEGDYFVYMDVDAYFGGKVTGAILSERVSVQHCGHLGERGPFETDERSMAFAMGGFEYYGGGFWCFSRDEFKKVTDTVTQWIDIDEANGITAKFHDESHLNKYLHLNKPTLILNSSYHYPEKVHGHKYIHRKWKRMGVDFEPKVVLVHKDHAAYRS